MTKHQNDFKIELKHLEDDLLLRLSAAEGSFLDDTKLVERLERTKATAAEIAHKVGEARRGQRAPGGCVGALFGEHARGRDDLIGHFSERGMDCGIQVLRQMDGRGSEWRERWPHWPHVCFSVPVRQPFR